MHAPIRKSKLALAIALSAMVFGGASFAAPASQDVVDARQETQIWTTYALSPYLRANDIQVSVVNGKATLNGKVDEAVNKELASEIALGVNGIKDVDNQITVEADFVPPRAGSERSYGERIDDASISTAVRAKLAWSKHTDAGATSVATTSGRVTLSGTVASEEARGHAGRLALTTRGVASVDNQLKVEGASPSVADSAQAMAADAGQSIADSWITTKVKSTFMYSNNVSSSDISVSTTEGVVTLSGKLSSGAERALAIELAQNVRGVKRVDSTTLVI